MIVRPPLSVPLPVPFSVLLILHQETRIFLTTNHTLPVAVLLDAHPIPLVARYRVLLASIILFLLYALIISELVHQTIAAMFCAFLSLSCLSLVHDRPSLDLVWIPPFFSFPFFSF
eukprot:TRINITY_DN3554_c0_g2_i13.p1 TRINITY_DN3554_c0_g2~~TRINITY_DN3554_c0_g2_i13.p1  ORF type:complete len:116 (+),score=10.43 TRINITY_DN3554_c0_g2_i13:984-1331(+)